MERNQLALDRYKASHKKSKWQIGRDYELYIGYRYSQSGYSVDYFGSYMGLEDLGRDLICKKGNKVLIVQCKYWSSKKEIHEKHITPNVVFVDPPRRGLDDTTINNILKLSPEKLVYISCNPATMVRDLSKLEEKYNIKEIQPVDMFPFTSHVECVSVLHRKSFEK